MKQYLVTALVSFMLGLLGSALGGSLVVLPALEGLSERLQAHAGRLGALESGLTTPISAEARARLDQHTAEISAMRAAVERTNSRIDVLLERLARDRRDRESRAPFIPPKGG